MRLPKTTDGNKNLTEFYGLKMDKTMKIKLEELKTFYKLDTPEWIRGLIQEKLDRMDLLIEELTKGEKL